MINSCLCSQETGHSDASVQEITNSLALFESVLSPDHKDVLLGVSMLLTGLVRLLKWLYVCITRRVTKLCGAVRILKQGTTKQFESVSTGFRFESCHCLPTTLPFERRELRSMNLLQRGRASV